jgi:hypothetical protein
VKSKTLNRILTGFVIGSGVLAWFGWYSYLDIQDQGDLLWTSFYSTLQTFIFETGFEGGPLPGSLRIAAYLAPLSLAASVVVRLLQRSRNAVQGAFIRIFISDHAIITGLTDESKALLSSQNLRRTIVLLVSSEEQIPEWIFSQRRIIVLVGSSDSVTLWKQAGVRRARQVFIFDDSLTRIHSVLHAVSTSGRRELPFPVGIVVSNAHTHDVLSEFPGLLRDNLPYPLRITPINTTHHIAAALATELAPHRLQDRSTLEANRPHIVIEGMSALAEEFLLEAGQQYHYPWHSYIDVTIAGVDEATYQQLLLRHPGIERVLATHRLGYENDKSTLLSKPYRVVVFSGSAWTGPQFAREWRRRLLLNFGREGLEIPISVVIPPDNVGANALGSVSAVTEKYNAKMIPMMSMINTDHFLEQRELIDDLASAIAEGYARDAGEGPGAWARMSDWVREWNRRTARHLETKLWFLGYKMTDEPSGQTTIPEISAEQHETLRRLENQRWQAEKWLDGFIPSLFPSADKEEETLLKEHLRIHKLLIPFNELSEKDRLKDDNSFDFEQTLRPVLEKRSLVRLN